MTDVRTRGVPTCSCPSLSGPKAEGALGGGPLATSDGRQALASDSSTTLRDLAAGPGSHAGSEANLADLLDLADLAWVMHSARGSVNLPVSMSGRGSRIVAGPGGFVQRTYGPALAGMGLSGPEGGEFSSIPALVVSNRWSRRCGVLDSSRTRESSRGRMSPKGRYGNRSIRSCDHIWTRPAQ